MKHAQTIAMAQGLLAEGRAADVARMLAPLVDPLPDQAPEAVGADQLLLRCLLARVRLLGHGDAPRALALLEAFDAPAEREALHPAVRAEAALWLGWTHTWPTAGTYDGARGLSLLVEAERLFRREMNAAGRCWALLGQAWAYVGLDEYPLMLRALHDAAALQETVEDFQAALWTLDLHTLGACAQGRYARALAHAEALKKQARHADDAFAEGRADAYLAMLFHALGRSPDEVVAAASEAVTRLRRVAEKPGYALLAAYRAHLGAEARRGAWSRADRLLDDALETTADHPSASAHLLLCRARLDVRRGRLAPAEAHLDAVAAQRHRLQHRLLASRLALTRCELETERHRWAEARTWAERAYDAARETGLAGQQLRALLYLIRSALKQGSIDEAHRALREAQRFSDLFSVLPVAAQRLMVLGDFVMAEDDVQGARAHYAQAHSAYTLIGDVYHAARAQEALAAAERAPRPAPLETLHAPSDGQEAPSDRDPWPVDEASPLDTREMDLGALLARASLSVALIAETWLDAAARLLPDRWIGIYRCDEGHPWTCVRERGLAPTLPRLPEPCGPLLVADEIFWVRLRSHPGPAFFFGVALHDRGDPAWQAAYARLAPWLPVASLALDHALMRSLPLDASYDRPVPTADATTTPLDGFVYASPSMHDVVRQVQRIRTSHSPILLTGERGVGKAALARAVHALSERSDAPFVAVACAREADALLESRLFGHADGPQGALPSADGGTLFLADVDALPLALQQKLLLFLQDGAVLAPGASAPARVDARLIASSPRDLTVLAREGRFLENLSYRLTVIPIHVPPLRERREEIPLLVRHFMNVLRPPGTPLPTLTNRAAEALLRYDWPGNVRQLRNEIERVLVLARNEPALLIDVEDFSPAVAAAGVAPPRPAPAQELGEILADTEKKLIERVLAEHDGRVTASAGALGLTRQGLYKKMKRLGIDASRFHPEAVREP